ncbi:MAG: hypothetical protein JOY74_02765, partial [Sinobacteraceae bacterium]|nr:hypothetical protein [Nevskiaceae bacterium]
TRPTLYDLLDKHSIDAAQFGRQGARATAEAAEGGENPAKTPVAQSE